ncbi:MAG: undecaprenyl-diphosphate phosphatase, partial [Atopobiaceae bacterium]|nr:undecaprenyl-diphosphate phosphatase [Atopobiaceae bacterium]
MDIIELLKAVLFGVVEGITEWLPISSTGHMLLLDQFVKLNVSRDFWDMFLVVIQLGAILAVCVLFFEKLNPFSRKKSAEERRSTWSLWAKVVAACIPAAAVGIPLDDWMEEHLGSPYVIAAALIVYGIAFIVIETVRERKAASLAQTAPRGRHMAAAAPRTENLAEMADADA